MKRESRIRVVDRDIEKTKGHTEKETVLFSYSYLIGLPLTVRVTGWEFWEIQTPDLSKRDLLSLSRNELREGEKFLPILCRNG